MPRANVAMPVSRMRRGTDCPGVQVPCMPVDAVSRERRERNGHVGQRKSLVTPLCASNKVRQTPRRVFLLASYSLVRVSRANSKLKRHRL